MMTVKEEIYNLLISTKIPTAYNNTDIVTYPRILFNLISNISIRASNLKHNQKLRYQIAYFSKTPLEVENDASLAKIEQLFLDNNFLVSDWYEVSSEDPDIELASFQYILEVRK